MRLVDLYWPVAQMVERLTVNQMVAGSSPAGSAILRGVAVVAYQPHKLVVAGSSPAPATIKNKKHFLCFLFFIIVQDEKRTPNFKHIMRKNLGERYSVPFDS